MLNSELRQWIEGRMRPARTSLNASLVYRNRALPGETWGQAGCGGVTGVLIYAWELERGTELGWAGLDWAGFTGWMLGRTTPGYSLS